jgi:protocatechuate 3,4-dioxygenase, alpha subunit
MAAPTPSQTVGPFFAFGLCLRPRHELVDPGRADAVRVGGRVIDGAGEPVPDAMVEIWGADEGGGHPDGFGWGRCGTDADGRYEFVTVKPGPVPHPDGGVQAPHLEVAVFARGLLKHVVTRMYFPDEAEANEADPVLASVDPERRTLLVARDEDGGLRFDIRLQGERETPFFDV